MTYFYDERVERFGKNGNIYSYGTYIMPNGALFDIDGYSSAHGGSFILPFFRSYMHRDKDTIKYSSKEKILGDLIRWKDAWLTKKYDLNFQELQMRLHLVQYFINIYKSNKSIYNLENEFVDFSEVTGIPNNEENWIGKDENLKAVLVQACNYDSIESQRYRTITTSKFNIYETFYDYILHDYQIFQIPKKIYDENLQQYIDYKQSIWFMSDKELRLKAELEAICKEIPLEERHQYCRNRIKSNNYIK